MADIRLLYGGGLNFSYIYGCINNESVAEVLDHLWSDDRIWIPNKELEKYADKTG